jgi:glycosyltransferase involved in cell wall biosynthesis
MTGQEVSERSGRLAIDDSQVDIELVQKSGLFDREWYLDRNPDVRNAGFDPLNHFLQYGWRERRDPGPRFRVSSYLAEHPEIDGDNVNALIHFLCSGGSFHNPRLDADWRILDVAPIPHEAAAWESGIAARPHFQSADLGRERHSKPLNLVLVNYGSFDNNSAIQITGLANTLTRLGHCVVLAAHGDPANAGDFGAPRFRRVTNAALAERPLVLSDCFADTEDGLPHLVHCWTPRLPVQPAVQAVVRAYNIPYVVHFEDNEMAVSDALSGKAEMGKGWPELQKSFIADASGTTIIVEALRELMPKNLRTHLFEPGVNLDEFSSNMSREERKILCDSLNVPNDALITVYTGNLTLPTMADIFGLYVAVHALNRQGLRVHLIRTGIDAVGVVDPRFVELSKRHVTTLGLVRRDWVRDILRLADFFVQPGGPDNLNKYRLPSKIPEMLAVGRPLLLPAANIGLLLKDRVNALIMQRGDALEIIHRVKELFSDPDLPERLGRAGREFAIEHFDWQRSALRLVDFYRQILLFKRRDLIKHREVTATVGHRDGRELLK